ncbi:unnamed protein product [Bemisia tabaci]|uniref:Peptidase C1A papain C-terminal domain-containing protein n=1 Tax=Bemisia tabaci TaxID=7038 RepID=A0A9P0AJ16_BEMTA|nr:unnamed protein product [Bemisia tabaci]
MLVGIVVLSLILVHGSHSVPDVTRLLQKHPNWSFRVESIENIIQRTKNSTRGSKFQYSNHDLMTILKANLGPGETHIVRKVGDPKYVSVEQLPSSFDAREHWPHCADLLEKVEDEGHCHADSPAVVASIMTDRMCIFSNGAVKEPLSQYVLTCAETCTNEPRIQKSWNYTVDHGIPTGGAYGSKKGCYPNPDQPCFHSNDTYHTYQNGHGKKLKPCNEELYYDRVCPKKCSNPKYRKSLDADRKRTTTWYWVSDEEYIIRNEIMTYGSVATSMELFEDLLEKPKGIYWVDRKAKFLSFYKYMKLIGWGVENDVKYWLAVNTWDSWGDNKVFKVPRGINYWYIEFFPTAGVFEDLD